MFNNSKKKKYIIISKNKKAKFKYNTIYKIESGIMLLGNEVKSIKLGHVDLSNSFGFIKKNEIFLHGLKIQKFKSSIKKSSSSLRTRKLLMHKNEIIKIKKIILKKKTTIIPLELYLKNQIIKLLIAISKGKSLPDKRESIKKRETIIQISKIFKKNQRML